MLWEIDQSEISPSLPELTCIITLREIWWMFDRHDIRFGVFDWEHSFVGRKCVETIRCVWGCVCVFCDYHAIHFMLIFLMSITFH